MDSKAKRVLVIGLDGATFDLIKPWADQGLLPNLSRLMKEGSFGNLRSTIQPTTAPAWSTFMTGVNQAKHGLYDFVRRRPDSYNLEITNGSYVAAPSVFQIVSQAGGQVVSINVPYTFPPRPVNGIMVGGPFVPTVGPEIVYPREFFEKLKKIVPDYTVLPDYNSRADDPMADYAKKLIRGIEMRETLAMELMASEPWQLFTVVFMATDEVQHTFWECMEAPAGSPSAKYSQVISQIYQRLDQAIGDLLLQLEKVAAAQETTVIILSDHGGGPFRLMINLNHWLAEAGFLQFRLEGNNLFKRVRARSIKQVAQAYRRYVPPKMRSTLRGLAGAERFEQAKGAFESALLTDFVDWTDTKAYSLGAGGNIYINLVDREPQGIVQSGAEYEQLREALIDALLSMRDPETGEAIIEKVIKREELYSGPHLEQAPDLVIQWADYGYWGRGQYDVHSPVFENQRHFDFSDQPLTGSHRLEGILIVHGAEIEPNAGLNDAHIIDLAPTILSLLGIKPLEAMDGRLLDELLTPAGRERIQQLMDAGDVEEAAGEYAYDPDMAEKISEHLRALGYL